MAKHLNVNLAFTADTAQAKAQLQDLQSQLTKLTQMPQSKLGLTKDINEAIKATAELKSHLQAATNVKTGNLDFAKLNQSITSSGKTLDQYANHLRSLGSTGQQAFMSLAYSVANAEIPIRRSNAALQEMWTTLKNTARWQLSSSILHGFMGAVQKAYGYAQDLNESLNDIRIVTGQSTEQMAKFAATANKAARELSTSTNEYAKASLIYYQQGLNDSQVKQRTDITVKMANVAKQSAETVSDQMTAVWNNFYDGSKSLEYYADVMTALGAATASSTDEISEGLNKFAAVAETVGLSYEYAASALATITSNTRESADVVGNALKTLFARIQGLKLGETLEDGVDLNKYSEALDQVGIKILDSNGELKTMDTLLTELAGKWDTIGKAEQTALAQTVAGVRQYTQLIALMENWDNGDSDSMVANLQTAYSSTGALDQQANIYAESWEAAGKRVKAAAEQIYNDLLDDKFFIKILNNIEKILLFVDNLIDGLGGLKGVLLTVGSILTKVFSQQMSQSLKDMAYNLKMSTEKGRKNLRDEREGLLKDSLTKIQESPDFITPSQKAQKDALTDQLELQIALTDNAERMTDIELATNQALIDRNRILNEQRIASSKKLENKQNEASEAGMNMRVKAAQQFADENSFAAINPLLNDVFADIENEAKIEIKLEADGKKLLQTLKQVDSGSEEAKNAVQDFVNEINEIKNSDGASMKMKQILSDFDKMSTDADEAETQIIQLVAALKTLTDSNIEPIMPLGEEWEEDIRRYIQLVREKHQVEQEDNANKEGAKNSKEGTLNSINNPQGAIPTWADGLVSLAGAITAVTGALQSLVGLWDVWNSEDMTAGEKLLATFSTLGMVIPNLIMSFSKLNLQQMASVSASLAAKMGFAGEAQAAIAAGTATAGFGATLYTVLWPIGLVIVAITALIGIFALVAKSIKESSAAFQLEELKKSASELSDQLEETKTAAEELKDAFSSYDDIVNKLSNCTKGTEEWYQAIKDVNSATAELIQKYPGLESYVDGSGKAGIFTDPKTGAQMVNENYFKDREEQLNKGILATNAALFYNQGQQGHLEAATSNVAEETRAKLATGVYGPQLNGYDFNSAEAIKDIQEIAKVSSLGDQAMQDVALKMAEQGYFKTSGYGSYEEYAAAYGENEVDNLRASLQETANVFVDTLKSEGIIDNLADYSKILEAPTLAEKAYNDSTARMYLSSDTDVQNSNYRDQVLNASGEVYGQLMKQAQETVANTWKDKDIETRFKEYASSAGHEDYKFSKTKGNDVYYTIGNSTEEQKVDIKTMQATIAAAQALEKLGIAADQLMGKMTQLGSSTDIADQALISFLSQKNFEGATKTEYEALLARSGVADNNLDGDIGIEEVGSEEVASYLGEKYGADGKTLTDTDAINYGYQSAKVMIEAFRQKIAITDDIWKDLKMPELEGMNWANDLSLSAAKSLENAIEKANLGPKGEEGGRALVDGINKVLGEGIDIDDRAKVVEQLSNIDWSDWDAMDQAKSIMEGLGYDIDFAGQEWLDFADAMRIANGAIPNFSDLKNDLIAITQILQDLEFGESISEEDYQALIDYKEEWKELFLLQSDGSRQFIGDASDMLKAERDIIAAKREEMQKMQNAQTAFNGSGWNVGGVEITDWSKIENQTGTAENLIKSYNSGGSAKGMMDAIGYSPEDLQAKVDKVNNWSDLLTQAKEEGNISDQLLAEEKLAQAEAELQEFYNRVEEFADNVYPDDAEMDQMMASTATSIDELNQMLADGTIEAEAYSKAFNSIFKKEVEAEGFDYEELSNYAELLKETCGQYIETEEEAKRLALAQAKLDRGISSLNSEFKNWNEIVKSGDKSSLKYSQSLKKIEEAFTDITGVDVGELSDGFLESESAMKLMKKAAEGDAEAIKQLQILAAQDIIQNVKIDSNIPEAQAKLNEITNWVNNMPDLEVGMSLNDTGMYEAFQALLDSGAVTVNEMNGILSGIGFNPVIEYKEMSVTDFQKSKQKGYLRAADGTYSEITGETNLENTEVVYVPVINADKTSVKAPPAPKKYGGSSGGGGSKAKDTKKASDEIERYHEIKEVISDLERQYDRINKARTRAFGMEAIELMDQEIAKTEELIDAQKKYLSEITTNREADKSALAAYGAQFDVQGRIINYDEIMSQQLEKFNASRTEEAEKAYEEFKKILEQYEETQNLLEEQEAALEELEDKIYDQKLEKVSIEVDLKISVQDDQLSVLEYMLEKLEDDAYSVAEAFALIGRQAEIFQNKSRIAQEGIDKILANHGGITLEEALAGGTQLGLTAEEIESLRTYRDTLLESNQALLEMREIAIEQVTNTFDKWNEKFEKQIELLEHYSSVMDSFANIVDIVGKDMLGISDDMMKNLTQASVDNAINTLEGQKKRVDALRKSEEELRSKLAETTNEEERAILQEALDHIVSETNAAEEDMLSTWEETLEAAADAFEEAIDLSIGSFEKAISGTYGSLEGLQTAFDQASEIADRYVDDYKEIYELSKLNRDITNSIDNTDNVKAKKALRDLQKEIVELQESDVQMSEYDLEHLRAKYELRLAEIALEEAQNAKSQVRMRKDSEGNYSYVFTADASAVEKAQQDYENKLYEMQELNSEYIKEMQNNILQSEIELANALRELDKAKFKSDEEYYAEVNRLTQYYTGQRNYYLDELNKGLKNNKQTVDEDWKAYSDATGYKMSADKDYMDSFDETIYAQLTGYRSIEDAQNQFADATKVMVEDLKSAFKKWQENTEAAMKAAGTSIRDFGKDVEDTVYGEGENDKGIVGASEDVVTAIEEIADEMGDAFGEEAIDKFAEFAENYVNNILPMIEATEELINQINELILKEAELDEDSNPLEKPKEPEEDEPQSPDPVVNPPAGPSTTNPYGKPSELSGLYQDYTERSGVKAIQHALKEMGYSLGTYGIDGKYGSITASAVKEFQRKSGITVDGIVGDETRAKFKAKGYLTGGRVDSTGWAWLDGTPERPEYVLNAEQTDAFIRLVDDLHYLNELNKLADVQKKGMLMIESTAKELMNSLEFVDDVMRIIELNAGMQSFGLGSLSTSNSAMGVEPALQQEITIHAEFPDATDHNEIEAAFDSLFVRASQFANRKN